MKHLQRLVFGCCVMAGMALIVWLANRYQMFLAYAGMTLLGLAVAYVLGMLVEMVQEDFEERRARVNQAAIKGAGRSIWQRGLKAIEDL